MADSNVKTSPAERAFVLTRVFDVPRELVFDVWTKREHLMNWFGLKGFKGMKAGWGGTMEQLEHYLAKVQS